MKAPSSKAGNAVAGALGAAAVAGAGYYLGGMAAAKASPNDATAQASGQMAGALLGALAAGFGGVVLSIESAKWKRAGLSAAVVGVGAVLASSLYGTYKQYAASAPAQVGTQGVGRLGDAPYNGMGDCSLDDLNQSINSAYQAVATR